MAVEDIFHSISLKAYANYSANQYCAVYLNSDGTARLCGANAQAVGILQNNDADAAGKMCTVSISGISKAKIGAGGVTAGDKVKCGASGTIVTQDSTNPIIGLAMTTAAENEIGMVLLDTKGPSSGASAAPATAGPIRMPLSMLTAAADEVTGIPLSSAGVLTDCYVYVEVATSLSGKAATLYIKNGTNAVATSDMALTSATLTEGNIIAATPSGSYATVAATDTLRIASKTYTSDFTGDTGVIWVYFVFTA